jgi:hypothetical protein
MHMIVLGAAATVALASPHAGAQKPPAVRQLGRLERVSSDSLASVATALPMPGGTVLVNDTRGRRLLLFDSTLAHARVIADTTSATANAYGGRAGTLIRYRADTAIFIDPSSLSMFVLGPTGNTVRVMAVPRPQDAQSLMGLFGIPGFDARGRLTYFGSSWAVLQGVVMLLNRGAAVFVDGKPTPASQMFNLHTDSAFIVRVDLATHGLDTVASVRIARIKRELRADAQGGLTAIEMTPDPLPLVDDWTMMLDGTLAIVRGRDYHVDWIGPDGTSTSSAKMPFDWQRVDDTRKQALIDSAVAAQQTMFDGGRAGRAGVGGGGGGGGGGGSGGGGGGRGGAGGGRGGGSGAGGQPTNDNAPNVAVRPVLSDLPDYMPPFAQGGAVRADADGNLWIRTTTMVLGQPVYDIVNRRGALVDRVQLPSFRTIAGFGPGVVYLAMKDATGAVHLERARVE